MSMMKDVSWGSIILGAAAVTTLVASTLSTGGLMAGFSMLAESPAVLAGAATVGAVIGNMTSKLIHRAQDTASTLVGR
jgi:hypothetical protein